MYYLTNISNAEIDLMRYHGTEDVQHFLDTMHLDGFEMLMFSNESIEPIQNSQVIGVHLPYFSSVVPFWFNDIERLIEEFGSLETAYQYYTATNKAELIKNTKSIIERVNVINPEYVVFHVSEVSLKETVSYRFHYSNQKVIDCFLEWINGFIFSLNPNISFLIENLWWPGFSFTNVQETLYLLNGIHYSNKGIILDIGHLLHTNTNLTSLDEGLEYIHQCLDKHQKVLQFIKGIHLHQTLSGEFVHRMIADEILLEGSYQEKLYASYRQVMQIDSHRPFLNDGVSTLVQRISPKYLVYEFITESRKQHESFIQSQHKYAR
ncbi:MAG: hypothetical protein ACOX6G_06335 [Christensenellales bacterium]|jgi:hypothetical protein|nr:hypothetical protein [Clostridiales bacterium]